LLRQGEIVQIGIIVAEQFLGIGDQAVQVRFILLLGPFFIFLQLFLGRAGRHAFQQGPWLVDIAVAMQALDLRRHVAHVLALVTVGRKGNGDAVQFQIAQPGGQRQDVHLPAGVVDIVFALDLESRRCQHAGQAHAEGGAAPVADVQRPGRIGGNEFHLDFLALAQGAAAKCVTLLQDSGHDALF
jgi:hypothetical protein